AASIPVSRMLIRASGVSGVATGGTTPNGPVGLGAEPFGVTTSGAPGEKTRLAPRYSDHETDAAQRWVNPTMTARRANVTPVAGRRNAAMPPPSHAAWDIAVNRQSPAATIAMASRAALGPMMRSTTALSIPPESQIRRPRIAMAVGTARMRAARS